MTDAPFVPSFDDDDTDSGRKLAIICSKGNLDMAYPGLILGNAALGEGVETHLFFTFWGFDMITKSRMWDLQFSPVGNTAMHLPGRDTKMPQSLSPMPGMTQMATKMMKNLIAKKGVASIEELRDMAIECDVNMIACQMTMDLFEFKLEEMIDGITLGGAATYMENALKSDINLYI